MTNYIVAIQDRAGRFVSRRRKSIPWERVREALIERRRVTVGRIGGVGGIEFNHIIVETRPDRLDIDDRGVRRILKAGMRRGQRWHPEIVYFDGDEIPGDVADALSPYIEARRRVHSRLKLNRDIASGQLNRERKRQAKGGER